MKSFSSYILTLLIFTISFTSCFHEEDYNNSKRDNFELLWKIIDQQYCFFEYKNINWQEIHERYTKQVDENMSNDAFFNLLGEMLAELKDGHVNLSSTHNMTRYWKWFEDYPYNFNEEIQDNYLGTDYYIAGGMKYKIFNNHIGYIYYGSFSNGIGDGNLDQIISRMALCKGMIIDIRHNGGGNLTNVEKIAKRFFDKKTLVGYMLYKNGKGHSDFSKPYALYIEPSNKIKYQNKVVILTNRRCFSAANYFVNVMKNLPNVTIIGDKTGGGSGFPFSSELVNGWSVQFSSSAMLNIKKEHTDFGIEPDIKINMLQSDMEKGLDTILETAFSYINYN